MTRAQLVLIALIPIAYLLGSIPFGLFVGFWRGIDVRKQGSGNIGATNVGRLLGGKFFALVFILDLLKGLIPTLAGALILRKSTASPFMLDYVLWLLVGFAAIGGHMFSLFLRFKGGKGVATSTGAILGVFPYFTAAIAVGILVWLAIFKATRYVSVASMMGAAAFAVAYVVIGVLSRWPLLGTQLPLLVFSILIVAMIFWKHRGNIARLRAGTEHRISPRQPAPDQ